MGTFHVKHGCHLMKIVWNPKSLSRTIPFSHAHKVWLISRKNICSFSWRLPNSCKCLWGLCSSQYTVAITAIACQFMCCINDMMYICYHMMYHGTISLKTYHNVPEPGRFWYIVACLKGISHHPCTGWFDSREHVALHKFPNFLERHDFEVIMIMST